MEQLYTVEEVAEILRITPFTCSRWVRERKLPAIRLNGSFKTIRIKASDLEAYIEEQKEQESKEDSIFAYN